MGWEKCCWKGFSSMLGFQSLIPYWKTLPTTTRKRWRTKKEWEWDPTGHHFKENTNILEFSVKAPFVSTPISSAFAPYPLFQWYLQNKEILLNLGMKCWNSAFNAQGLRVIAAVVKNICISSAGAKEKENTGWNSV
jgi:hypothetical protein